MLIAFFQERFQLRLIHDTLPRFLSVHLASMVYRRVSGAGSAPFSFQDWFYKVELSRTLYIQLETLELHG